MVTEKQSRLSWLFGILAALIVAASAGFAASLTSGISEAKTRTAELSERTARIEERSQAWSDRLERIENKLDNLANSLVPMRQGEPWANTKKR